MTNTTIIQSVNIAQIFTGINEATNGWFVGIMILFFWIITLSVISNMGRSFQDSMLYSSFILTALTGLLWAFGGISMAFGIIPVVLLIISILAKLFS